jgi:hypothetical protein
LSLKYQERIGALISHKKIKNPTTIRMPIFQLSDFQLIYTSRDSKIGSASA